MEKIYHNLCELVGNTPLIYLDKLKERQHTDAIFIAKLESFNPLGSVKDRVALAMIEKAEKDKKIKKGSVIIEPTSGNTGIGLAFVCAVKGYSLILVMPENMSVERRKLLQGLGAKVILTKASEGMQGAIRRAEHLQEVYHGFIPSQFDNPVNPKIHFQTTAEEIWRDCNGNIDAFVACVGTGGTISGVGQGLKQYNPNIRIIAVEPKSSAVLSGESKGKHKIQGIGAGFVPKNFYREYIDEIIQVSDEAAYEMTVSMPKLEGIFIGISSGAALQAAVEIGRRKEMCGKRIVILLPDGGEKYLSVDGLFT